MIVATNKSNEQFACDDEVTNEVVVNFYVLRAGMEDRIGRQVVALALYSAGEIDSEMAPLDRVASKKAIRVQR